MDDVKENLSFFILRVQDGARVLKIFVRLFWIKQVKA